MGSKKSFEGIRDDYAFFQAHSSEAASIQAKLVELLRDTAQSSSLSILDFGSGAGEFLEGLLLQSCSIEFPVKVILVEPDPVFLSSGLQRIRAISNASVQGFSEIGGIDARSCEIVLANHVLYYVPNLKEVLAQIRRVSGEQFLWLLTLGNEENSLIKLWKEGFSIIGMDLPFSLPGDVRPLLSDLDVSTVSVESQLKFLDTEENRKRITRFLFGQYFDQLERKGDVFRLFDSYVVGDQVIMPLVDDIIVVRAI